MDKIYTVFEVAELLKVDPETVRRWLRAGRLGGIKADHGWRILESDLAAWIERHRNQQPPACGVTGE